ncbi:AMPP1 [Hepatospora eriocheir]|uniref:AMPP1 n=1 Tax=Hepatospora eriocheir TaxID=1081669 RepID=A0A1X0QFJ3_9MICR|nr:AMPP1 [Hepatospora eriocheir]
MFENKLDYTNSSETMLIDKFKNILNQVNLDGFIIPMEDNHLNESININDNYVEYFTGFNGTAGKLLITKSKIGLYLDSRYYTMAEKFTEENNIELIKRGEIKLEEFFDSENVKKVGICPMFISSKMFENLKHSLEEKHIKLIESDNIADKIWINKPNRVHKGAVKISDKNRIELIRSKLIKNDEMIIITDLDTIAWITNLRGGDIEFNNIFYSFLVINKEKAILFVNNFNEEIQNIEIRKYDVFENFLKKLSNKNILIDRRINQQYYSLIKKYNNVEITYEVKKEQSIKTDEEIDNYFDVIKNDAIALIELFDYITKHDEDEVMIEERLRSIKEKLFKDSGYTKESFRSIVAINSPDIHHDNNKLKVFKNGDIVLLDTGSHYFVGATDISRTISKGEVNPDIKQKYTLVLKGVIQNYITDNKIESGCDVHENSKSFLKENGLSYSHATGHGVGIIVHDMFPQIRAKGSMLFNNQIFTIEPGYYHVDKKSPENEYGIRIEDMVFYKDGKVTNMTYVPYHLDLIDFKLLSNKEIEYLNSFNRQIKISLKDKIPSNNDYFINNTKEIPLNV